MQHYFENDHVSIGYDQANHIIITTWLTTPTQSEFRDGMNITIKAIEHFGTGKVIWDTRLLGILHPDDQQWAATEHYNNALKAGYSHAALLIPEDIFSQMSLDDTVSQVENLIPVTYTPTVEIAIEWMKQF
ncbi:MAG TPA: hypothetical protein VL443_27595 [Cyclobacteriaceae bacterium]|jgi:hypothetical protein|nr:hypothetical protein [Cyclobacteriaceae bacterium]